LAYNYANYNENNSIEITATLTGQANYNKGDGNDWSWSGHQMVSQLQTNYNLNISPDILYSNYIVPDTWHWFVEGSGYYSFLQNTNNSDTTYADGSYSLLSTYVNFKSWNASVGGGIGYGKLRDGSSVFAVLRILDKLTEDSVLVRPLTKDEVLQIVDIFAKKSEYSYSQDRYIKYFMEEIFGQLQKMGVLKENAAAAYSVLRAVEVLSEQIEPRLFGWRARIGFQRSYTSEISANDEVYPLYYTLHYLWDFRDNVSLAFDYGYPLTLNLQVNSSLSMAIPRLDYQRKIGYTFQLAGIYQVGERIDATLSGSISRTSSFFTMDAYQGINQNDFFRILQYNVGISFRFFIENNVNFNVSCGYSEEHENMFSRSTIMGSNVYKSPRISFGVNYRFF
jgi:hypothetical protein